MTDRRPIPGHTPYLATREGEIVSPSRLVGSGRGRRVQPERVLKPDTTRRGGHLRVTLHTDAGRRRVFVHRLVALAFHGEPPTADSLCRHLDDDPSNNRPDNLAWGTPLDNVHDRQRLGNTLSAADVYAIRTSTATGRELAERYCVSQATVSRIRNGRRWRYEGHALPWQTSRPSERGGSRLTDPPGSAHASDKRGPAAGS